MRPRNDVPVVDRNDVLRLRMSRHQLAAGTSATGIKDLALLDYGIQDTGSDGSSWAIALRGVVDPDPSELAIAWTLRGAPHAYRRADLAEIAVATAPWSDADASKRIFDAAAPLKAEGIPTLEALRTVAGHMRALASSSATKGEVSGGLTEVLAPPFLRPCAVCKSTHIYEQPFRLSALQAGLALDPGTSPPVLRRVTRLRAPMYGRLAGEALPQFDVVRNHLRFYGPARMSDVATFVDALQKEVKAHWPADAVEVAVAGVDPAGRSEPWFVLEDDLGELGGGGGGRDRSVLLLGSHDPYLQGRDRELVVPDPDRRKELWRTIGRAGAILRDREVAGLWRPRTSGRRLTVRLEPWTRLTKADRTAVDEQAERLARHRDVELAGVTEE